MTDDNPHRALRWHYDERARTYTAQPDDSAPYRVVWSGRQWVAVLGTDTTVGGGETQTAAINTAQTDYNLRRRARSLAGTAVPADRLITAMRAALDVANENLVPVVVIAVAAAMEAVAQDVGIDPALLRSETRP